MRVLFYFGGKKMNRQKLDYLQLTIVTWDKLIVTFNEPLREDIYNTNSYINRKKK